MMYILCCVVRSTSVSYTHLDVYKRQTLSTYAEHPETVTIGTNRLVGENSEILADALDILNKGEWQKGHLPERWDGHAAERIVQTLLGEHK